MKKTTREITLLPRKKVAPKVSITLLERVLFAVLILILVIWAGEIYYKKNLGGSIEDLTILIQEEEQKRDLDLEEKIYSTSERLESLVKIIPAHAYWTKIFTKLEEKAVPTVWLSDLQAQDLGKISLEGFAVNYSSLAYQFVSFSQDPDITKVVLSELSSAETGEVKFTFDLLFNPEVLLK